MSKHYNAFPNFSDKELACQHCGEFNDSEEFKKLMAKVQSLRDTLGFPFPITSGYRCKDHPLEIKKEKVGQHTIAAVDIGVSGERAYKLLDMAFQYGFKGIGIKQTGKHSKRFIHLDLRDNPTLWSY